MPKPNPPSKTASLASFRAAMPNSLRSDWSSSLLVMSVFMARYPSLPISARPLKRMDQGRKQELDGGNGQVDYGYRWDPRRKLICTTG